MNTHLSPRIPQLNLQVTLDSQRRPVVQQRRARQQAPDEDPGPIEQITRGSVTVKIYGRGPDGEPRAPFTIAWRESAGGARKRAMRSKLKSAIAFADQKATELANQQTWRSLIGQEDWASYQRSLQLIAPSGKPLELFCGETMAALKLLPPGRTLAEACQFLAEHQPKDGALRMVPEIVTEMLAARKQLGAKGKKVSQRWLDVLGHQLGKFAQRFTGPLSAITATEIDTWLSSLVAAPRKSAAIGKSPPVSAQTRAHYRASVLSLVRYAKFKRYLPKAWSEIDDVAAAEPEDAEIRILTPEQITSLLNVAPRSLVPFIAITAFAGVRHEEMTGKKKTLLDWSNITFYESKRCQCDEEGKPCHCPVGEIYVPKSVAKTGHDRLVPIQPSLGAWLRRYQKPNGRVCALKNSSNALTRAKRRAGIPTGRDETPNALRKSFISYRLAVTNHVGQVAEEAGTSVSKIRKNYLKRAPLSEGQRWFNIRPQHADFVQVDFGAGFGLSRKAAKAVIAAS